MKPVYLFAKALTLKHDEVLVIKFANEPEFSGELRLTFAVIGLPEQRKEQIRKVCRAISQYVIDVRIE